MGENGLAGTYYLEKYKREALAEIQAANDTLALESDDRQARIDAQMATIERFQAEYDEDLIHTEAGESRRELSDSTPTQREIKDLIRRYVSGEVTDPEALKEEKNRLIARLQEEGYDDVRTDRKVQLDNMLAIADQVKAMVDHGESIERVLEGMKIVVGEARNNVRTEAYLSKTERAIDRVQRWAEGTGGMVVRPETLGAAAAIAIGVTRAGRGTLLKAVGMTGVPGLVTGVFAGFRESKRIKEERALHSREMAQGKRYEVGKRRDAIEETRYETVNANDVTAMLNQLIAGEGDPTPEQVQAAYEAVALVEARIRKSDSQSIDLVSYSAVTRIPRERRALDEARANAKVRLSSRLDTLPVDYRNNLGITEGMSVSEAIDQYGGAVEALDTDIDRKDEAFKKLRRRQVTKAVAIGTATGFVFGLGAQEIAAFANPSYDGLAEHMFHPSGMSQDGNQTVLEGLLHGHGATTTSTTEHITPSSKYEAYDIAGHKDALELPQGYNVITNADGTVSVADPTGHHIADNLAFDKNGALTPASAALLHDHNISTSDMGAYITTEHTVTKEVTVTEFNENHAAQTTHVTRDFWYDNNTPKPQFDKNELKLWWGGANNNGVAADGHVQMSVAHMTQAGSYEGIHHTSWSQDAAEGKLKLAVSASRDTQAQVYMIDVKPDGTIDIPPDSPAAKFFSVNANGQAEFHGAYAEVAEVRSTVDGVTHIAPLATEVGDNSIHTIPDVVKTETKVWQPHLKLTPPAYEKVSEVAVAARTVEGFGMPGIVPRRPLEALARERSTGTPYYGSYEQSYITPEQRAVLNQELSPRLKEDPGAILHPKEELDWYKSELETRRSPETVAKIEQTIAETPELRDVPADLKTIVTIPVGAAFESKNIFNTLSLYGQQDPEALQRTVVLLNVNWLDTAAANQKQKAKIEKTLSEIERARHAFPQLKIAVIQHEYNEQEVQATGGVIGYAASDMVDTALLTIQQAIAKGTVPSDHEVMILRNDADMDGMSRHHLLKMQKDFEAHPDTDIFRGMTRLGAHDSKRYPGWGVASDLSMKLLTMSVANGGVNTGGANVAIRASTFAAIGGLGDVKKQGSGAGSDDTNMGLRIAEARAGMSLTGVQYGGISGSMGPIYAMNIPGNRKLIRHVAGANIDTNAARLVPPYLRGEWWQHAWRPDTGTFNKGAGGYGARDVNVTGSKLPKTERFKGSKDSVDFRRLQQAITYEVRMLQPRGRDRILANMFRGAPAGSYTLTQTTDGVQFAFTEVGRKFVSEQMKHYSKRKLNGLYGKNLLHANESALVEPVNR